MSWHVRNAYALDHCRGRVVASTLPRYRECPYASVLARARHGNYRTTPRHRACSSQGRAPPLAMCYLCERCAKWAQNRVSTEGSSLLGTTNHHNRFIGANGSTLPATSQTEHTPAPLHLLQQIQTIYRPFAQSLSCHNDP